MYFNSKPCRAMLLIIFVFLTYTSSHRSFTLNHKTIPVEQLNIGLIVPYTSFGAREYTRAINSVVSSLQRSRGPRLDWLRKYSFTPQNVHNVPMKLTPSPTGLYTFINYLILIPNYINVFLLFIIFKTAQAVFSQSNYGFDIWNYFEAPSSLNRDLKCCIEKISFE